MVYQPRYSPSIPVAPPAVPSPDPDPGNEVARGVAPMLKKDNGNFDIGLLQTDGSYVYDGQHIVNVTAMTKEQLDQAAKELNHEMKRKLIESEGVALMLRIARTVDTPNAFLNGCWDEPFLTMSEPRIFDHFLGEESLTLAWILDELDSWLDSLRDSRWANEVLRDEIVKLGGKDISPPIPESPVPTELDKVKEKVVELEKNLPPTPGTPVEVEPQPDPWPPEIPERPTVPQPMVGETLQDVVIELAIRREYLVDLKAHDEAVHFIMGWCLEQIRVCLNDLSRAKAPGTQEDAFKANIKGLADGVFGLEEAGVFHD